MWDKIISPVNKDELHITLCYKTKPSGSKTFFGEDIEEIDYSKEPSVYFDTYACSKEDDTVILPLDEVKELIRSLRRMIYHAEKTKKKSDS